MNTIYRTSRRRLLSLALCAGIAAPLSVHAQDWPTKPVRIVVPAGPGGSADPLARLVAEELGKSLKQSFVVENRPGANGNVGAASVVKSTADGYTLLFGWTGTLVPAITLYHAKPYHPQRDLDPIVLIGSVPNVVVVDPSLGVKSLAELTAYAKSHPGQLNFGSTGSGSSYHLSGELYKKTMGVSMLHIPYNSPGAVFTDLVGGRLQVAFPGTAAAAPLVKDGRLRAVAVMADKRSPMMPDVPTTSELGFPALVSDTWFGLLAPKGTPAEIRQKINQAVNAALKDPQFNERLIALGFQPLGGSADAFASALASDIEKWGEVVRFSGAKID
ncbi:tripartite tricarboxylate transporter substrate binding protein [Variovorax sp.]|uniref:Bug family tripartite tricarboxylate transporter substrate binding protein n=1 Tax=Variovorax sp. TaxID=1871043 RepID=UPI002D4D6FBD|nr:tripartite tricarboxylate transporter substrate binding protein [Variovorax sp.]HYP85934.1 tripartite tricarboxylate transporter substrate binding protein [Variovorax sp.]